MLIPPKYILTPKIVGLLQIIEAAKEIIDSIQIPKELELNIRRSSTLKSSLFSARIEGNNLTLDELPKTSSKDQRRKEVFNILKGINWIFKRGSKRDLTTKEILKLHQIVMEGLIGEGDLGFFRQEISAIYNKAGIAIYLPPRPALVPTLISRLTTFINSSKEQFIPIKACLAHYTFEKIHPFLDGNGRVGRLLLQLVLEKGGYGMKGLVAFEEYLDTQREKYYENLDLTEKEVSDYLEFMLQALASGAQIAKMEILKKRNLGVEDLLLPRRAEILRIIKDQKLIKFDIIRRRFLQVNERTLRYDLKKLADANLIKKRGTTNGVYYEILLPGENFAR